MFQSIGQWLYNFLRHWFEPLHQIPESTEIPPLTNEAYESLLQDLIAGINLGWTKSELLDRLGARRYDPWFAAWLRRYGRVLERISLSNDRMAAGVVKLGQLDCGDLSVVAEEISQRIVQRKSNLVELSESRCLLPVQQVASRLPLETENHPPQSQRSRQTEESLERVAPTAEIASRTVCAPSKTRLCQEAERVFNQAVRQYKTGELLGAIALWGEAIAIQPNLPNAYNGRGSALYYLGRYDEAIADYTQAVKLQSNFHLAYNNRGNANSDLGNHQKALADYSKAIAAQPDFHLAYNGRASVLNHLGHSLWAIADYSKAIELKPDFHFAYNGRGIARSDLGQYSDAIADFTQAIAIRPNYPDAYNNRGNILQLLGNYTQAIADFTQALDFNPNLHQTCYSRGNAYRELGCDKEAIADFTQALHIQPNYYLAYNSRGLSYRTLGNAEAAIADFNRAIELKSDFWQAWANLGWTLYQSEGDGSADLTVRAALQVWNQGLEKLNPAASDYKLGRGTLHYHKGKALYYQAQKQDSHRLYLEAIQNYQQAIKVLQDRPKLREIYLEVLQDLIIVYSAIGDRPHAKKWGNIAIVLLEQLLLDTPTESIKQKLSEKFTGLYQLEVDRLAQSLQPKHHIQALELAEERKNLCLKELQPRPAARPFAESPNYAQIQSLIPPNAAALYWHISPVGITTFIVKPHKPPIVLWRHSPEDGLIPSFQAWLKQWQQDFERQHQAETVSSSWQEQMTPRLRQLAAILDISQILSHLEDETCQLLLVPHQDLHLLPLQALFCKPFAQRDFTIAYLPSAQLGLQRPSSVPIDPPVRLLAVEPGRSLMPYQELERRAIAKAFPQSVACSSPAVRASLIEALQTPRTIIHLSEESYQHSQFPEQSSLCLDRGDKLTLPDLLKLDFSTTLLICLPDCSARFQGQQQPRHDFIGLAASFLLQGATSVLLSLWPVRDFSTALLMHRFYEQLQRNIAPAKALNDAQRWLREATLTELLLDYEALGDDGSQADSILQPAIDAAKSQAAKMGSDYCPYAHPYYWAGFMLAGTLQ